MDAESKPISEQANAAATIDTEKSSEPELPKLSATGHAVYNSMAEHMEYFYNHFRQSWDLLYTAFTNNRRPPNHSTRTFIQTGLQLCSHLSAHHSIEEHHIFPVLARKMPELSAGRDKVELLMPHDAIHKVMDGFESYLIKVQSGETELDLRSLKEQMDGWGNVLWTHLDQEVVTLGAENMRKYWSLQEMKYKSFRTTYHTRQTSNKRRRRTSYRYKDTKDLLALKNQAKCHNQRASSRIHGWKACKEDTAERENSLAWPIEYGTMIRSTSQDHAVPQMLGI